MLHPNRSAASLVAALLLSTGVPLVAQAAIVSTTNPGGSDEIGARIRWGSTGFEATIRDPSSNSASPNLNPPGTPAWIVGSPYNFQILYNSTVGQLTLNVDFNRDLDYLDASESASRSSWDGVTSYAGLGYNYLHIYGSANPSSTVSNLTVNGTSLGTLFPNGVFLDKFWKDSSNDPLATITIDGNITFNASGTGAEAPSWNFAFRGPEAPVPPGTVPEPGSLALAALGLLGLRAARRRAAVSREVV